MAKMFCTLLGIVFLLVGVLGFFMPNMAGAHLSSAHNVIHLVSGAVALYFGLLSPLRTARAFCLGFGALYLLLGLAGFFFGSAEAVTLPTSLVSGAVNDHMFRIIPGILELGTMDHVIHLLLGSLFLIGGFLTRTSTSPAAEFEQG